jgi:hypothetical protein
LEFQRIAIETIAISDAVLAADPFGSIAMTTVGAFWLGRGL